MDGWISLDRCTKHQKLVYDNYVAGWFEKSNTTPTRIAMNSIDFVSIELPAGNRADGHGTINLRLVPIAVV